MANAFVAATAWWLVDLAYIQFHDIRPASEGSRENRPLFLEAARKPDIALTRLEYYNNVSLQTTHPHESSTIWSVRAVDNLIDLIYVCETEYIHEEITELSSTYRHKPERQHIKSEWCSPHIPTVAVRSDSRRTTYSATPQNMTTWIASLLLEQTFWSTQFCPLSLPSLTTLVVQVSIGGWRNTGNLPGQSFDSIHDAAHATTS